MSYKLSYSNSSNFHLILANIALRDLVTMFPFNDTQNDIICDVQRVQTWESWELGVLSWRCHWPAVWPLCNSLGLIPSSVKWGHSGDLHLQKSNFVASEWGKCFAPMCPIEERMILKVIPVLAIRICCQVKRHLFLCASLVLCLWVKENL